MYYEKFFPFYAAYPDALLLEGEQMEEYEFARMKSYYPEMAGKIQEEVEMECELLDYEGSRIYDVYPDRMMLREIAERIRERVEPEMQIEGRHRSHLSDLIEVLLYQEISRRRCRHRRCRKDFYHRHSYENLI